MKTLLLTFLYALFSCGKPTNTFEPRIISFPAKDLIATTKRELTLNTPLTRENLANLISITIKDAGGINQGEYTVELFASNNRRDNSHSSRFLIMKNTLIEYDESGNLNFKIDMSEFNNLPSGANDFNKSAMNIIISSEDHTIVIPLYGINRVKNNIKS